LECFSLVHRGKAPASEERGLGVCPEETPMETNTQVDHSDCPEDCPRCNRCPHTEVRRQKIEALILQVEMEKERYMADGVMDLLPTTSWHERVMEALAA
jgi:hypothetical protein